MALGSSAGRLPKGLPLPGSLAAGGEMAVGPDRGKGVSALGPQGLGGAEKEGAGGSESEDGGGIKESEGGGEGLREKEKV